MKVVRESKWSERFTCGTSAVDATVDGERVQVTIVGQRLSLTWEQFAELVAVCSQAADRLESEGKWPKTSKKPKSTSDNPFD